MWKFLCCLLSVAPLLTNVVAVRISPFVDAFDPTTDPNDHVTEKKKEFTYFITNKMNETIAFEVTVFRRLVDKDGNEKLIKDEDSFAVFPSQLIIAPHKERVVKLRWIGNKDFEKNPRREQSFRVSIKQFHINLNPFQKKKRGSSVEIGIQAMTSLYMTPGSSRADPVITKIQILPNELARVSVENRGTRRIDYNCIKTEISLQKYKGPLLKILPDNDKDGAIQPGETHEFVISTANLGEKFTAAK